MGCAQSCCKWCRQEEPRKLNKGNSIIHNSAEVLNATHNTSDSAKPKAAARSKTMESTIQKQRCLDEAFNVQMEEDSALLPRLIDVTDGAPNESEDDDAFLNEPSDTNQIEGVKGQNAGDTLNNEGEHNYHSPIKGSNCSSEDIYDMPKSHNADIYDLPTKTDSELSPGFKERDTPGPGSDSDYDELPKTPGHLSDDYDELPPRKVDPSSSRRDISSIYTSHEVLEQQDSLEDYDELPVRKGTASESPQNDDDDYDEIQWRKFSNDDGDYDVPRNWKSDP